MQSRIRVNTLTGQEICLQCQIIILAGGKKLKFGFPEGDLCCSSSSKAIIPNRYCCLACSNPALLFFRLNSVLRRASAASSRA